MPTVEQGDATMSIILGEHDTTGPLPVGFEFERQGAKYDCFDVSTDGFITFSRGVRHGRDGGYVPLMGDERGGLRGGRVTYEVLGTAPRRRLLVVLAEADAPGVTLAIAVYERTGIVEVRRTAQSLGDPTIRQLDIVQSSPSSANSARKIG